MTKSQLYRHNMITNITIVLIGLTLVNSGDLFIYPSQISFYFFSTGAAILLMIAIFSLYLQNKTFQLNFSLLPFSFLVIYILFHGLFTTPNEWNTWHYYYLSAGCLFIAAYILLTSKQISIYRIETGFICLAVIETAICTAQYIGWLKSMNTYLPVSGSWTNPNVTAMFIALVFPIAFLRFTAAQSKQKIIYGLTLCLLLSGLYLLKCRSAYLCVIMSGMICCYFCFRQKLKTSKALVYTITVIFLTGIIPAAIYQYQAKKESADGRLLIYKTTLGLIAEKPVSGYGFGLFEKYYNLKQATYFNEGHATAQETNHAGHVNMAYNELLQHCAEGGLPGLILFIAVFVVLLYRNYYSTELKNKPYNYHLIAAYSGVAGYFLMSLVNFTWQAIPVTCVFIFYAAVLAATDDKPITLKKGQTVITLGLLFIAMNLLYRQTETIAASHKNKTALIYTKQGKSKKAVRILEPLAKTLGNDESFWNNLARSYFISGKYQQAIDALEKAELYSSKPAVFHLKAHCYEKLGMTEQAIANWHTATLLEPNRMLPHYYLMNLYVNIKDHENALLKARQLIAFKPKRISEKAVVYKRKAEQVLAGLGNRD